MRRLTIERLEGIYAICVDAEKKFFAIEQTELPKDAAVGNILELSDDGTISVLKEKTKNSARRR